MNTMILEILLLSILILGISWGTFGMLTLETKDNNEE